MVASVANGPGRRVVVWVQGCHRDCAGCCNPEFRPFDSLCEEWDPIALADRIIADAAESGCRGLTLSGGEPLHPAHLGGVAALLRRVRATSELDVFAFTGYTPHGGEYDDEEELWSFPRCYVVPDIDMLIAGPFDVTREHPRGLVSSDTQVIVRNSHAFDDMSDEEVLNGKRLFEVRLVGEQIAVTGLLSREAAGAMICGETAHLLTGARRQTSHDGSDLSSVADHEGVSDG